MNWIEITAEFDESPEDWSFVADLMNRYGCPSTLVQEDPPRISGCVVEDAGCETVIAAIRQALDAIGARAIVSRYVPDQDWTALWRAHFKPRRIGARLVIRPTWESAHLEPDDLEIVLDPGQAFGTGDHPTTRMCLQLLEGIPLQGRTFADVGCGSGVLSIAASLLGAKEIVAIDSEPEAIEVAMANFARNEVKAKAVVGEGFEPLNGKRCDVVASNLISAAIVALAPDASRALASQGSWIISGILNANWPEVQAAVESAGLTLVDHLAEDDWHAARLDLT